MSTDALLCPACSAAYAPGDRFCADCGARLEPPLPSTMNAPCAGCGGTEFVEGFCADCGARQGAGTVALVISPGLAAATDPGRQHTQNQDAFDIAATGDGGAILVVCDGVSNSQTPDVAAALAARTAAALLAERNADPAARMRRAIVAAHDAVCRLPYDRQADIDPPACTIVAAQVERQGEDLAVMLGWLGDSRAYSIGEDGACLLTHDHSWVNQVVDSGELGLDDALRDRRAHALIRCLGTTDFTAPTPCPEPSLRRVTLRAPGWLLLCSDGLWNYADSPNALLAAAGNWRSLDAEALCRTLLGVALGLGGHDNVTVAALGGKNVLF